MLDNLVDFDAVIVRGRDDFIQIWIFSAVPAMDLLDADGLVSFALGDEFILRVKDLNAGILGKGAPSMDGKQGVLVGDLGVELDAFGARGF